MNVCIYGASSNEIDQIYEEKVYALGRELALRGMGLVFGGGAEGVMGAAARGVHDVGGKIIGVAPRFFNVDGVLYEHCTEFIYTDTMRERKQIMEDLSDAFITAPGGFGTFEEFFEILTLKQLGRHKKALLLYNICGYYDPLMSLIDASIGQKFVKPACLALFEIVDDPKKALDYIEQYQPVDLSIKKLKNI